MSGAMEIAGYGTLLTELKTRIYTAQYVALRAVNKELIALYRDIGQLIEKRQITEGWGKAVVERLSADLRAEFGEKGGFSGCHLWYMRTFYREYKEQPILQPLAAEIAWTKNTLILDRCQNPLQREFYLRAGILLDPSANQAETVVCPSWQSLGWYEYSFDGIFHWGYIPA